VKTLTDERPGTASDLEGSVVRDQARLAELHFALDRIADSVLELPARLNAVTQVIRLRLGCDVCSVYVLEPEEQTLVLRASFGLAPESVGRARLKVGEGVTGWVAEHLEAVALADAPSDPRFKYLPETQEDAYRSLLSVPIVADRSFVGVINVQRRSPYAFPASEVLLVGGIGYKVGAMIRAARLEADLLDREAGLDLLLWATEAVSGRHGAGLTRVMLDRCRRALGANGAVLRRHDPGTGRLFVAATDGLGTVGETLPALTEGVGIAGDVLARRMPFRSNNYAEFAHRLVGVQAVSSSILCVPLLAGERPVGTLSLLDKSGASDAEGFSGHDQTVLSGVARLLAGALPD
jgi:GAF domain-containing protein